MHTEKVNKLRDIQNISFGQNIKEIVSTLDILVMMFEFDNDPDIVQACRIKMQEGIGILKNMEYNDHDFKVQ